MKIPCEECISLAICKNRISESKFYTDLDCEILCDFISHLSLQDLSKVRQYFGANTQRQKYMWFDFYFWKSKEIKR